MRPLRSYRRGETSDSLQLIESSGGSKVPSERVVLLVLGALLAAALVLIWCLIRTNIRTHVSFQRLRDEHEALRRNLTEGLDQDKLKQKNLKCEDGWEENGGKCFYFSMTRSPWSESRAECQRKGGDLLKIQSGEEQDFLNLKLPERMDNSEDMFWIGLTDTQTEGTWLWVDGSLSDTGFTFWGQNEPDNLMHDDARGQDCARVGGTGFSKHWFDRSCRSPQKSICEKPVEKAETGL